MVAAAAEDTKEGEGGDASSVCRLFIHAMLQSNGMDVDKVPDRRDRRRRRRSLYTAGRESNHPSPLSLRLGNDI